MIASGVTIRAKVRAWMWVQIELQMISIEEIRRARDEDFL